MKLKKLTINNIASIEHAEIDFDAAPLANEHLFLISGETGSGKSTIIDCICLALYDKAPRFIGVQNYEYSSGENKKSLMATNTRQLMRRGSVSADICLTFDDNNGIPYIATWEVHRANNKPDGTLQAVKRTLLTEEGVMPPVYIGNSKEINSYIARLIGLDMEQFSRTVVLAQGKFAEFLNSDEKEKAALLEKMTGTEVYAQMGEKIYQTYKQKEQERDLLLAQLQGITLLSEDERAAIMGEVNTVKQQLAAVQKIHDTAEKMTLWLNEKAKNAQDLADKQHDLADKQAVTQQQSHKDEQRLVNDWDATTDARRDLKAKQEALAQIETLEKARPVMQQDYDRLSAALRAMVADIAGKETALKRLLAHLEEEKPRSAMFEAIKTIKTLMKQRKAAADNVTTFGKALEQEQARFPEAEKALNQAQDAVKAIEQTLKQSQEQYDAMNIDQVNGRKDDLNTARQCLNDYKNMFDAVVQQTQALQDMRQEREGHKRQLDSENETIAGKRATVEQMKQDIDRLKDWNALVEQAHKTLHQGDKCPVCGNIINTLNEPEGQSVLDGMSQQLADAERLVREAETRIGTAAELIKRLDKNILTREKDLNEAVAKRDRQWQQTRSMLVKCGKKVDEMADIAQADLLIEAIDQETGQLSEVLKQAQVLNKRISQERDQFTQAAEKQNAALLDLNNVKASIEKQREAIDTNQQRFQELTQELSGLFAYDDWQERSLQPDFIADLEKDADNYKRDQQEALRLDHAIELSQSLVPAMQAVKESIHGFEDHNLTTEVIPDDLSKQWNELGNSYLEWGTRLKTQHDNAERARQSLDDYLHGHPDMDINRLSLLAGQRQETINAIRQAHKDLADNINLMLGEVQALTRRQQEIAAARPECDEQDPERLADTIADTAEQMEQLAEDISSRMTTLKSDEENHRQAGEKKQLLDAAEATCRIWGEFNDILGDATGSKFRKIAQSYILGELLHGANDYLRQFNEGRFELEANPGQLTILVRDLQQGDLTSVNTLSGGESFMVSLALALALSNTTGKVFSVDTLFIDEGFGSLSEGYLDNVMDTLNRLYDMGGRRVGLISHVELLKERVLTQIKVERDPGNNTVSRVMVTTA